MKKINIVCILFFIVTSCTSSSKSDSEFPIINIEEGLKDFHISNLSDYASSIHYVRLETNDDCLVTRCIRNIYLEDNKIFVHDSDPYLKVFDAKTGKYIYNIGAKGQGPGELSFLSAVDINRLEKKILLCSGSRVFHYDFEGNFLGAIEAPPVGDSDCIDSPLVSIGKSGFAGIIRHCGDQEKLVVLFNDKQEITGSLKCYENPLQPPNIPSGVWDSFSQGGLFYRSGQNIRYFRGFTDTIYSYKPKTAMFSPFFIIDYGKYKSTLNYARDAENPNLIKIASIKENDRFIFLDFSTENASPEPYEKEADVWFIEKSVKLIDNSISGIFDKQKQSFHFLLHPLPGIPGLKNDIDGGIPFFVRNVSSKGELIDYYHACKFLEQAEGLSNPSESFSEKVNQISEDDNPIVLIAE